jgi:tight adherence protein B
MVLISILFFFVATFLMIAIAVVVASMALRRGTTPDQLAAADGEEAALLLRSEQFSTISLWHRLLDQFDFADRLQRHLAQADLSWSVGRLTLAMLLAGSLSLVVLLQISFLPRWAPFLVGTFLGFTPWFYVLRRRSRRFRRFQEAFPDALDSLARALRAGYPFAAALDIVASEAPQPVAAEMRKTAAEVNLGLPWAQALEGLGKRVPLAEVNLFGSAVHLHSRTGGKLSEVMLQLSENMRESIALEGEVRALAAHGKLTGYILTALPFLIAGMMAVVSPDYMKTLVNHPMGGHLITAAVVCLVLAQVVIRKIVDIRL